MHPINQLMKSVVRIEAILKNGGVAWGSGFAYRLAQQENGDHIPAIITNKHVIHDAVSVSLPISTADANGAPTGKYEVITYNLSPNVIIMHPDKNVDLCAILSAPIHKYFEGKSQQQILAHLDQSLLASDDFFNKLLPLEEVTMIGYPNGIWDSINNGSIARRGVIATNPSDDYMGEKQFVIDMACFPGSSGSPVILANFGSFSDSEGNIIMGSRLKLLGILYAGPQHTANGDIVVLPVPTVNKHVAMTSIPNNLGYVIKASEILKIDRIAATLLK